MGVEKWEEVGRDDTELSGVGAKGERCLKATIFRIISDIIYPCITAVEVVPLK